MSAEQKIVNFKVKGDLAAGTVPALYSNFLAVSQVGNEIQFEFIFLDLNQVAMLMEQLKATNATVSQELDGKTVAKIIMPAATLVQLREHFEKIFEALKNVVPNASEVGNELRSSRSKG